MLQIHPSTYTTPAVRAETARSTESSGLLASRDAGAGRDMPAQTAFVASLFQVAA